MPKLPKNKKQLGLYISEHVVKEFKEFAKGKHDGMYGVSIEAEKAIVFYLSKQRNSNYNNRKSNFVDNRVWILKRKLREYLCNEQRMDINNLQYVKLQDLKKAIQVLKGTDKRTVDNYIQLLKEHDCIKINDPNTVDIS